MLMKRILVLSLSVVMVFALLAGCGGGAPADSTTDNEQPAGNEQPADNAAAGSYEDGIYFAQEDGFAENGWKYMATIEVKDGKIVSADWNGANIAAGKDKKTASADGDYGMVAKGGASAEWHEQAALAETFLIEKQDPAAITYTDDEGHTDAISGASIHVKEFFDLAQKALAKGPVGQGMYKDGAYHAEEPAFGDSGWKYTVDLTVVNGYIVASNWNGIFKDGGKDKKTSSADGDYGMVAKGGASAEWHEQAVKAEAYLLETQDPAAIEYTDDEGHTDAISGASIHVKEFFELAAKALEGAKK